MPRALISVSDKTGIVPFARDLSRLGWQILSTGGTSAALRDAGIAVTDVSEVTHHPEMMHGRVKTLHPAIHAGILARRHEPEDLRALGSQKYELIDLVVVNLYPFHEAAARNASIPEAMEQVDIGGPSLLRAAAKNHAYVYVVVDPADYARVLHAIEVTGGDTALRQDLARKVFAHTAAYDKAIADYFARAAGDAKTSDLPESLTLQLHKAQDLRYGENPEQRAAFYAESAAPADALPALRQLQGKELSFNNLLDIDAAVSAASAWAGAQEVACVIVKHTTPCGVAVGPKPLHAYTRALACDPVSAFGGVVAFNSRVDADVASAMAGLFLEIVIAPAFDDAAVAVLEKKKNLRLIELPVPASVAGELDYKRVRGGLLVQDRLGFAEDESAWKVVTQRAPTAQEMRDMQFAWRVVASVKSNAIVLARDGQTLGIGAGQMSRVDSSRIAVLKAQDQKFELSGAALASDAYFPFRDGVDAAAAAGVRAVIQPGGSVRDAEVIAAADEHGIAMVFTGRRVFRH